MQPTILLVDDDPTILNLCELYLNRENYQTIRCQDGREVQGILATSEPDLIVLDVMLPGIDGKSLCQAIRTHSTVPIIMLTALSTEKDRIEGFDLGADDYLAKPFSPKELAVRIRSILRRTRQQGKEASFQVGQLQVSPEEHRMNGPNGEIPLTPTEFVLLLTLAQHPGRVYQRNQLVDLLGDDFDGLERTVDVHIMNLRKKIKGLGIVIRTVYGVGYKLELES